ncbi:MAG TPA: hypothetical protein VHD61_02905 [Lacunisphaera sp.]|nr:hypothetical protein [Lacunisphaera sp.]
MKKSSFALLASLSILTFATVAEATGTGSPAEHLPPHIRQLTSFGERPDWSPDGKRVLFLTKTFGDAMEIDLASGAIRNLTAFYPHHGYTRALYLANGDILLSGPVEFDPKKAGQARNECYLFILDKGGAKPPQPLGVRCNEGPAVSRHRLHLAWTEWTPPSPGDGNLSSSKMFEADLDFASGGPKLSAQRLILDGSTLPFRCTMETQNYRPPAETELTFSAYTEGGRKSDVCGIDLRTGKVTKYTDSADTYDEPEGIYPDGQYTLVECDQQNHLGTGHIDLWRLKLDGSGEYKRLTYFSDFPNYKASNPVVSDDGRYIAFQMGRAGEAAGVGHGIFIFDLVAAP